MTRTEEGCIILAPSICPKTTEPIHGLGPFRWGSPQIPKEQLEKMTVKDAAEVAWGWLIYQFGEEAVSMRVKGRKRPINIITMDGDSASHLAYRMKKFIG